jgi:hypothetical protein
MSRRIARAGAPDRPLLFVLLGASNLARAHRALIDRLRRALPGRRCEYLSAVGPGRAYCVAAGILNVRYPPIGACGVVERARDRAREGARVVVLLTDIGNDIMHGVPTERLIATLDALLIGLIEEADAHVVTTAIPLDVETDLGALEFRCLRAVFFPRSRVGRHEAGHAVRAVNRFLEGRASPRMIVVSGLKAYVGWDHIHYGMRRAHAAWTRISDELAAIAGAGDVPPLGPFDLFASSCTHLGRLALHDVLSLRDAPAPLRVEI